MTLLAVALVVFASMATEAARAARNERARIARGAVEPAGDVYHLMRVAYPAAFGVMLVEGVCRGAPPLGALAVGGAIFAAAKLVKWSAIRALGPCWTFRVLVVPDAPLVSTGPYRYLRHPNYVGVVGELLGTAVMARAWATGAFALVAFGALILKRLAVEERALGPRAQRDIPAQSRRL